jgi:hypothetical protein
MNNCKDILIYFLKSKNINVLEEHSIECNKDWKLTNYFLPHVLDLYKKENNINKNVQNLMYLITFPYGDYILEKKSIKLITECVKIDLEYLKK